MRKSNYDKFPSPRTDGMAIVGWEKIVSTLNEQWADEPVWAIDLYPGTYDEDFLAAQRFKKDNNRYTPSLAQIVSIKGKLVCGTCGERMARLSPGKGIVKWKCRKPSCQCPVRLSDDELIAKL